MKRSVFIPICLILSIAVCLSGCSFVSGVLKSREFEKDGLSITLDVSFGEVEHEAYTAAYQSDKMLVFTLKDNYDLFADLDYDSDMSLTEYAEHTISANGYTTEPFTEEGLVGFTYNYSEKNVEYTFIGFVYKGTNCFWHVQFGTEASQFESLKPDIFKFAKQVKIS